MSMSSRAGWAFAVAFMTTVVCLEAKALDFLKVQSGGYSARFSLGMGSSLLERRVQAEAFYGYDPQSRGQHFVTGRVGVRMKPLVLAYSAEETVMALVPLYAGVGVLFSKDVSGAVARKTMFSQHRCQHCFLVWHIGSELSFKRVRKYSSEAVAGHGVFSEWTFYESSASRKVHAQSAARSSGSLGYKIHF